MKKTLASAFTICALAVLPGCVDPEPDDFGTVLIELQRSKQEATSPYLGTGYITAFLDYEECLSTFYTTDHPEFQQNGVEGGAVFEEWQNGKLCDKDRYGKAIPSCSVTDMQQNINTQGATDVARLVITYDMSNDEIEGQHLPFGPLPVESLAGCSPTVRLTGGSVQGKDGMENQVWRIASFDDPVAHVGQGASITIFAERSN